MLIVCLYHSLDATFRLYFLFAYVAEGLGDGLGEPLGEGDALGEGETLGDGLAVGEGDEPTAAIALSTTIVFKVTGFTGAGGATQETVTPTVVNVGEAPPPGTDV